MTIAAAQQQQRHPVRSTIPARLDRLRWSPFHTRLVLGLGTAWILDGLEITIASSVSGKLTRAALLTVFVAWIAFRTVILAVRGHLFPARPPGGRRLLHCLLYRQALLTVRA